jgi:type IV pilus assembly protein PilF
MMKNWVKYSIGMACLCSLIACTPHSATANATADNNAVTNDAGSIPKLAANPKAASINTQLGIGYLQQGDTERAKLKLLMAEQQDPHSSEVIGALAYYYDSIGNSQQAEKYYRQSYSMAQNKGEAANNYGVFLCKQKQYAKATDYFQKAISDPNYVRTAEVYENLGLCAMSQNNTAVAKDYFTKALRINSKLPSSLLQMAQISVTEKQWTTAQNYLSYYTAVGAKSPDAIWLQIQVAKALGDKDKEMSLALQLKNLYPKSSQYQQYLAATRGAA